MTAGTPGTSWLLDKTGSPDAPLTRQRASQIAERLEERRIKLKSSNSLKKAEKKRGEVERRRVREEQTEKDNKVPMRGSNIWVVQ